VEKNSKNPVKIRPVTCDPWPVTYDLCIRPAGQYSRSQRNFADKNRVPVNNFLKRLGTFLSKGGKLDNCLFNFSESTFWSREGGFLFPKKTQKRKQIEFLTTANIYLGTKQQLQNLLRVTMQPLPLNIFICLSFLPYFISDQQLRQNCQRSLSS